VSSGYYLAINTADQDIPFEGEAATNQLPERETPPENGLPDTHPLRTSNYPTLATLERGTPGNTPALRLKFILKMPIKKVPVRTGTNVSWQAPAWMNACTRGWPWANFTI
jgi:hypothetical protein